MDGVGEVLDAVFELRPVLFLAPEGIWFDIFWAREFPLVLLFAAALLFFTGEFCVVIGKFLSRPELVIPPLRFTSPCLYINFRRSGLDQKPARLLSRNQSYCVILL